MQGLQSSERTEMSDPTENNDGINPRSERERLPEPSDASVASEREPTPSDLRASLEGATDDGMSAIYVTGTHRFVTPCHASQVGLRASQVCATCHGDLKRPVSTAHALSCGHWTNLNFAIGERRLQCTVCDEWTMVRAEQVIVTRFYSRPLNTNEQLSLLKHP